MPFARGLAAPTGSLDAARHDPASASAPTGRSPRIRDFVPLAALDDLVFGGWDIFEDDGYEAARKAQVLQPDLLERLRPDLEAIAPIARPCSTGTT